MTNSANLPAPFQGQDTLTPTAVLRSPYCETLYNFNATEAGVSLRRGDSKWASKAVNTTGSVTAEAFEGFVPYGSSKLFACVDCTGAGAVNNRYYDISTEGGAPSLAYTSLTAISGEIFTTQFAQRVFTFGSTTATATGDYYDGTNWGTWGYTMPAGYYPIGGCAYKNRQYFIFRETASYGYSEIDAVTDTVTRVDLSGVIRNVSPLAIIAPVSISNETSATQLLAFVFFSGEVLFYSGSYPDSASWALVATGNISEPLNYNCSLSPYQGDTLIACRTGLVSLRDLFLRGSEDALRLSVSQKITPDWTALIDTIIEDVYLDPVTGAIPGVSIAWWKTKNRIVVFWPVYIDDDGDLAPGSSFFVLDTLRGSWSYHRSFGESGAFGGPTSEGLVSFKGELLFCSSNVANSTLTMMFKSKEGATDYQDVNNDDTTKTSFDFEMLSAPIPFPKTAVYEATQIEPILESDLYAETNWNLVADFGRQTSGDQKTDAATTAVAKPAVNVGMQNITYVQVKMSGTTAASKTVGLDLYSYNVWYNSGETGSR